jgi:hypothetical protein
VLPVHREDEYDEDDEQERRNGEAGKRLLNRSADAEINGRAGFPNPSPYGQDRWRGEGRERRAVGRDDHDGGIEHE